MDFQWSELEKKEYIEFFRELIRINTSNPSRSEREAVAFLQVKLHAEGIETRVIESKKDRCSLVATMKGSHSESNPIVLLSHLDVVEAKGEWRYPPFEAELVDGIIYGRGTLDTKQLTAMQVMSMILIKRRGIQLERDLICIAAADEEQGSRWGMQFIKENHVELTKPGFVISEGGGFIVENKNQQYRLITAGEKGCYRFRLRAYGNSGHASCPPDNQAILKLNEAVERLCDYPFQETRCPVSDRFDAVLKDRIEDETLKNLWEYMTKSGFVFPEFSVGGAINVLPAEGEMKGELRFIPGASQVEIEALMEKILTGTSVCWETISYESGFMSRVDTREMRLMEESAMKWGEDAPLLPILALGRTDGRFMSGDIYGFSPVLADLPFSEVLKKVHGIDECISVESLIFGLKVLFETITEI